MEMDDSTQPPKSYAIMTCMTCLYLEILTLKCLLLQPYCGLQKTWHAV